MSKHLKTTVLSTMSDTENTVSISIYNSPSQSPYLQILLNHLFWSISQEYVKVKDAPNCAVSDRGSRLQGDL